MRYPLAQCPAFPILPVMASSRATENPEGATEPSQCPIKSIEDSLRAVLARLQAEFTEFRDRVKALAPSHPDRPLFHKEAVRVAKRIAETRAILDRRHWKEEAGKKKRGRKPKAV